MHEKPRKDLGSRTRRFAFAIVRLYIRLPPSTVAGVLGRQLLKSGTSVGAHYREARRAKSDADFISKLEGALQELDETGYWLELLQEAGIANDSAAKALLVESNELMAIFVSMVRKTKGRAKRGLIRRNDSEKRGLSSSAAAR